MKTERQSSSGSEGPSPSDDGDFADVESGSNLQGDDQQYEEYDVNKFLDNVLTGVGTDDGKIKRLGKVLRKACAEGNFVQLVRGVLHLVELYQAGKRSRSRTTAVGRKQPSKNLKKEPSRKAVVDKRHRHDGEVQQGRNTLVDLTEIEEEENAETSEADRSRSNQGQDENEELEDLESSIISNRGDQRPPDKNEEELQSEAEGGANDNEDANTFEEDQESIGKRSSSRRALLIPEDESSLSDTSRLDPSYPDGARGGALKRRIRRNRKPFQKKRKTLENVPTNTDGQDSSPSSNGENRHITEKKNKAFESKHVLNYGREGSSSSESDVSRQEDDSSFSGSDQDEEAESSKSQKRGHRNVSQKKKVSEEYSSSIESDVSTQEERSTKKKPKRSHNCPVCKKAWPNKSALKIHSRVHTLEKPFACSRQNCGKTFSQRGHLDAHLRSHDGIKLFKCAYPRCKKAFASWGGLDAHKRGHTGVMPFKCKYPGCFKEFAVRSRLRTHEGVHTRPFTCPFQGCGKAFGTKENLQTHQRKNNHN